MTVERVLLLTYLCVCKTQHGGQLPSVGLRHVLLHFKPLFESFALQVGEDRARPGTLLLTRRRWDGRRLRQTKIDRRMRETSAKHRHTWFTGTPPDSREIDSWTGTRIRSNLHPSPQRFVAIPQRDNWYEIADVIFKVENMQQLLCSAVISDDARLSLSVWRLSVCRVHRA